MDQYSIAILTVIAIFYLMIAFVDQIFKSCMLLPYNQFLKYSGIDVKLFRIQWHTTSFNRMISRWSNKIPHIYRKSLAAAVYITMVLFPISIVFIISNILTSVHQNQMSEDIRSSSITYQNSNSESLELLLPGVNLPINHFGYYILTLLVCSLFHEVGHAIAAHLEEVPVLGFGIHLIFIIPIAYTEIDTSHFNYVNLFKKLKIFSAGIWNNIILAILSYVLLLSLPVFLMPIYETDTGVFITNIRENAPVRGENGLYKGDSITHINGCIVNNEEDFEVCMMNLRESYQAYCVDDEFIRQNEESDYEIRHDKDGIISCCPPEDNSLNCFENLDEDRHPQYICLSIRKTIEHSENNYCKTQHDCPQQTSCVKALMNNSSSIIHIKRRNRSKDFVYFGHPSDILVNVKISKFIPKTKLFNSYLGDSITTFLKYLVVFSSGLAIINLIPGYGLDGQLFAGALISSLPSEVINKKKKDWIYLLVNVFGSILLFLTFLKAILNMVKYQI